MNDFERKLWIKVYAIKIEKGTARFAKEEADIAVENFRRSEREG